MRPYLKDTVAYVPKEQIVEVMARAVRLDCPAFNVLDDRGGTGMWQVVFPGDQPSTRKEIRAIVGPGIHVQEL